LAALEQALVLIRGVVRSPIPAHLDGPGARRFVTLFSEAERVASSGVALFTPRVVETGEYTRCGHGTAADWLGAVSGSSSGAAKGRLAAAARAAKSPLLTEALHDGDLSSAQLALVTTTSAETPEVTGELLDLVDQGASHQELSGAAARLRAARRSCENERLRRARVHANRHFRWHQVETGGIRGEFFCDEVTWATSAPLVEAEAKRRWKAAGHGHDGRDSFEAYRLDALMDQLGGRGGSGRGENVGGGDSDGDDEDERGGRDERSSPDFGPGPRRPAAPRTLIIVNAESLRRGTTQGDELCEIDGIGPVSVAAATELLSEGGFQYLVKEGFDIKTVTKSTRAVRNCVEMALVVRDRECAVPGCGNRFSLERDHWQVDYGKDGPTELDNLVRLCPSCHALKTDGGWRLEGGPGNWKWVAPAKPPTAHQMARARKVAVAKAKGFVTKDRNRPRQT
jgi:hypothetical protein